MALGMVVLAAAPAVYAAAPGADAAEDVDGILVRDSDQPGGMVGGAMVPWGGQAGPGDRKGGMGGRAMGSGRGQFGQGDMMGMKGGMGGRGCMDETEVLPVIKKYDPAFAAKLAELKTTAPQKYKMAVMMTGKMIGMSRMENDESLAADAVKAGALEFGVRELSAKYDKSAEAGKAGLKAELKLKVAGLFDLRLKGQELRIRRMEKDVAKLKSNLESRKANKAKIVDERLGQLTGEGYGW
jgi:hypothetical protein